MKMAEIQQTNKQTINDNFFSEIRNIISEGRENSYTTINSVMVETYWKIGRRIVEEEHQGQEYAEYGKQQLKLLSEKLDEEFGKGFSFQSLYFYRKFYKCFPHLYKVNGKVSPLWKILPWSHYKRLLSVENEQMREWYMREAVEETWSYQLLDRNISTQYFERRLIAQNKGYKPKSIENKEKPDPTDIIKNPTVAEFLGLSPNSDFSESDLESAIITNLQKFLLELGKGFSFVARQQHIRTDENDYFIDLVFYNYLLKSFVLIDLKSNKITYQDVGQMDMYLQMYDDYKKQPDDNPTIGIILCADTDGDVAKYSTLAKNDRMFASKYKLYMPTQEELRKEIERQKQFYQLQKKATQQIENDNSDK